MSLLIFTKYVQIAENVRPWKSDAKLNKFSAIKYFLLCTSFHAFGIGINAPQITFSRMKYLKHKYRTRLANDNLEAGIRSMVSNENPDFARLVEMVPE
ncbi:hypothetical protein T11_16718 [Trichinella zimbabwensis]|uniref:Uncharacterized protein n=1 Tax=Trichinella zimbabwensis TaxID=268475 RepID=A0A0V1I4I9_9BILA|nr:hypothetical protein T11_16718 [Trichinella zimbabwensis]